jgi:prepilin-type N-terminal cleavage/methylation domain-containing protein
MRLRAGFTLLELIIVMAMMAGASTIVLPPLGRSMAQVRLQRAATVIAGQLQLAQTTAARQRRPVRLSINEAQKVVRIRDYVNPATVYAEQRLDTSSENVVQRLEVSDTSLLIYPTGMATKELQIRLTSLNKRRVIRMTRAGQIRIEG